MPDTAWVDPEVHLEGHLSTIKYPEAERALSVLKAANVPAMLVGTMALNALQHPREAEYFNDMTLLVKHGHVQDFITALARDGWRFVIDDDSAGTMVEAPQAVIDYQLSMFSPWVSMSRRIGWPSRLWLNFYSSRSPLFLIFVDITDWFDLRDIQHGLVADTTVTLPPTWGLALYMMGCLVNTAYYNESGSDQKLQSIVGRVKQLVSRPDMDWDELLARLQSYEQETLQRLDRRRATLAAAWSEDGYAWDDSYALGVFGMAKYALDAVETLYPGTVPNTILSTVSEGTGTHHRTMVHNYGTWRDARYRLGTPTQVAILTDLPIAEQIRLYPDSTVLDILNEGRGQRLRDYTRYQQGDEELFDKTPAEKQAYIDMVMGPLD